MSAFVAEAERWARHLVHKESRGPGDQLPAMRRVAARARIPFGFVWNLHYRLPKTLDVEKYAALGALYADEQQRRYEADRTETFATTAFGKALMRAADRLGGEEIGDLKNGEEAI